MGVQACRLPAPKPLKSLKSSKTPAKASTERPGVRSQKHSKATSMASYGRLKPPIRQAKATP